MINVDMVKLKEATNILTSISNAELVDASANIVDPYRVYDGIIEPAYAVACDATGACDVYHTYQFSAPTKVLTFKVSCALAINSPKEITLYGSNDNITFDELLVSTQDIVVDNYIIDKRLDISKYNDYTYYKVHVTKGPNSGDVIVNEYYLLKEV